MTFEPTAERVTKQQQQQQQQQQPPQQSHTNSIRHPPFFTFRGKSDDSIYHGTDTVNSDHPIFMPHQLSSPTVSTSSSSNTSLSPLYSPSFSPLSSASSHSANMMPPPSSPQIQLRACQSSKGSQTEASTSQQEPPTIVHTTSLPEEFSGTFSASSTSSVYLTPSSKQRKHTGDDSSGELGLITKTIQKLEEAIRCVDDISNITTNDMLNELQHKTDLNGCLSEFFVLSFSAVVVVLKKERAK